LPHNPLDLFSQFIEAVKLARATSKLSRATKAELENLAMREKSQVAAHNAALSELAARREEAQRHASFDAESGRTQLLELEEAIVTEEPPLQALAKQSADLDERLADPVRELRRKEYERDDLQSKMDRARDYLDRLDATSDKTERYHIHKEREADFGTRHPRDIIKDSGPKVRRLERDIAKLEAAIEEIVYYGSIQVRKLVVDGSNLRALGRGKHPGLGPLRAVLAHIEGRAEVVVFFDPGIVSNLGLRSGEQLSAMLPGVDLHITAPDTPADRSILEAASEPGSYVLSNDLYGEFEYMAAVSEKRVLRHDILDGQFEVRGLQLKARYPTQPPGS
jgi:hypothetical protein